MPSSDPLPRLANGVVLRRLAVTDVAAFQAYRHDAGLGRYQGWSAVSDDEASSFLSEMSVANLFEPGAWCQIGIADPRSDLLLGDIGVFLAGDGAHAEIGVSLGRESQGHGLATDAVREAIKLVFEQTKCGAVHGITDARNLASIRLLERVGMRRTETRDTMFRSETCVEYVYVIARP